MNDQDQTGFGSQHASEGSTGPVLTEPIACIGCAYSLMGLPRSGLCPECGTPIERTLEAVESGFLIAKSDPLYVRTLLSGTRFVLNGILAQIIFMVLGIAAAFAFATNPNISVLIEGVGFLVSLAIAFGWWRLSEPDPALAAGYDGGKSRRIVRICLIISVATGLTSMVLGWIIGTGVGGANVMTGGALLIFAIGLVAGVAGIVAFFAQMLYIKWLAPRLPNHAVAKRSKTLLWLGPVLYTFGMLLVGLGPLIALILYWNMLDKVRKDLKAISEAQDSSNGLIGVG